jgi:Glycosyltransferase family 9 (heptosyltransferase)
MRGICRGDSVDAGTAAELRDQWAREAGPSLYDGPTVDIVLTTDQRPGDALVMTAAIVSLHRKYPGRFRTAVRSPWPEVFECNPYVVDVVGPELAMHYPAIHDANHRCIHFMGAYCEHLGRALGVEVPLLTNRPHLYGYDGTETHDFWVVCIGGGTDFTNKLWPGYQEVVDSKVVRFVQVGLDDVRLRGVIDMVGRTTLRELFGLVSRSKGVLCGVSLPMHVAAAFGKPAVIVAGGREPVQWNAYPNQHYLHSALPCAPCWRARTVLLDDGSPYDGSLCVLPEGATPRCMNDVRPRTVVELVEASVRGSSTGWHGAA